MMLKGYATIGTIGAVILSGFLYVQFFSKTGISNHPSSGEGIIVFGDSLVEGVGSKRGDGFVGPLSRSLRIPIKNYGRSGDTTAQGLERLPILIAENPHPKVVVVLLGGNDYLRKVPIEQTFGNLRIIITEIQKTGAVVVLLGVRGGVISDKFEEHFENLADEMKVEYVSDVLSGIYGRSEYMSDAIHPNDAGYGKIAERVNSVLVKLIK